MCITNKPSNKPIVLSHYVCSCCKKTIIEPTEGFHITGNISFADPNSGKGIMGGGNWLRKVSDGEKIFNDDIPESVYCKICFCTMLGISYTLIRKPLDKIV